MAALSGREFLERRSAARVHVEIQGETLAGGVADHPAFRNVARSYAELYDMQHDPAHRDVLTYPSPTSGEPVATSFLVPETQADLVKRRRAFKLWADRSFGMLGRTGDYLNSALMALASAQDWFARADPPSARTSAALHPYHGQDRVHPRAGLAAHPGHRHRAVRPRPGRCRGGHHHAGDAARAAAGRRGRRGPERLRGAHPRLGPAEHRPQPVSEALPAIPRDLAQARRLRPDGHADRGRRHRARGRRHRNLPAVRHPGGAERVKLFRLVWDTCISAFSGRQALYEYYFFGDPGRMAGAYVTGYDREPYQAAVRAFLDRD
jgi:4-hydroxyphenylacetate 3-hydroxylase N terminal/4-hydroxyphenylacetate 3-hydroxylase C terminal